VTVTDEKQLAACIDYTLLKPTSKSDDITQLCEQAKSYGFYSVCVNPRWVDHAVHQLAGCDVKICTVVGFPTGAECTKIKVASAEHALFSGADEIDMVADLAAIIEGDSRYLVSQLQAVMRVIKAIKTTSVLKVIIESAALTREQKLLACAAANDCKVDFVKTSTGLHPAGGASIEDVKLIKENAPNCKVKAAGGIKTAKQAVELLDAGANRLGISCAVETIEQFKAEKQR